MIISFLAMFVSFIALLISGYPIAYCLAGISILFTGIGYFSDQYLGTTTGLDFNYFGLVVPRIYNTMSNWVLISVPMFIFMGLMLDRSGHCRTTHGVGPRAFRQGSRGACHYRDVYRGIAGRIHGNHWCFGRNAGAYIVYQQCLSRATISHWRLAQWPVPGLWGILIPPSIMLVMMGDQLSVSVGDLFLGAVLPGTYAGVSLPRVSARLLLPQTGCRAPGAGTPPHYLACPFRSHKTHHSALIPHFIGARVHLYRHCHRHRGQRSRGSDGHGPRHFLQKVKFSRPQRGPLFYL